MLRLRTLSKHYLEFISRVEELAEVKDDQYIDELDVSLENNEIFLRVTDGRGNTRTNVFRTNGDPA